MTPNDLQGYLGKLIANKLMLSVMIWGPPGVGKSSVVAEAAKAHELGFIDLRLSQLAPTDLRGLPVPKDGVSRWYPPEFLPREGRGILFLDELNMAPPALQGIAQQLILDRRVGSYVLPDGYFVWAAGNRKEDRGSVFDMPSPLANRFLHLEVLPDFDAFKTYAIERELHEQVLAFLSYRPALLHKIDVQRPAWPSPRSWEMASKLHGLKLRVGAAVGEGCEAEFEAFLSIYAKLGGIDDILKGKGRKIAFPEEPSERYAIAVALSVRVKTSDQALASFRWLKERAAPEWVQLWATNMMVQLRARGQITVFAAAVAADADLQAFLRDYQHLLTGGK